MRRQSLGCPVLDATFGGGIPGHGIIEVHLDPPARLSDARQAPCTSPPHARHTPPLSPPLPVLTDRGHGRLRKDAAHAPAPHPGDALTYALTYAHVYSGSHHMYLRTNARTHTYTCPFTSYAIHLWTPTHPAMP